MKFSINKGSYGNKKIIGRYIKSNKNNLTIFIHGSYSTTLKDKYFNLVKSIKKQKLTDVVLFETSREISYQNRIKQNISHEKYSATFDKKTFADELSDVKEVVKYSVRHFRLVRKKNPNLHFVGISLGGILQSLLISKYKKYLRSVILLGSWSRTNYLNRPILSSMPDKSKTLSNYENFNGLLTIIHGIEDKSINPKYSNIIFSHVKKARYKQMILIKGADHRFTMIDGKPCEEKLSNIVLNIIKQNIIMSDLIYI